MNKNIISSNFGLYVVWGLLLFQLSIFSLCCAMKEQNSEQNPLVPFATAYGDHDISEEEVAQAPYIIDEILFITKQTGPSSFNGISCKTMNPFTEEGKVRPAIDLRVFIHEIPIKEFIINEYKKDADCVSRLLDKVFLVKEQDENYHSSNFFTYPLNEKEVYKDENGIMRPGLDLKKIIHDSNVKKYIAAEYKKDQASLPLLVDKIMLITERLEGNLRDNFSYTLGAADYSVDNKGFVRPGVDLKTILDSPQVQEYIHAHYEIKKSFVQRYPKTLITGGVCLGAISVGTLWWWKTKQ